MPKLMGESIMSTRRSFIKKLGVITAGISLAPRLTFGNELMESITILHTNDIHSHLEPFSETDPRYGGKGGLNRISAFVKMIRKQNPNVLLFDSGDFSQGTPYYNYFKGEVILKLMSEMQYNVGTIGNHEFDNGIDSLSNVLDYANFPIVNSNYDFSKTALKNQVKKHLIIEQNGLRIGVYGLGIELEGLVNSNLFGNTIYNDPIVTAREKEEYLKHEENCNLVVCLSHLGYQYDDQKICDLDIAKETSYTDLILGGHTHTFLDEPVELLNKKGEPVLINQVGWGALMLGQITFYFERQKKGFIKKSINRPVG